LVECLLALEDEFRLVIGEKVSDTWQTAADALACVDKMVQDQG
jgi:hypothetical protein